MAGAALSDHVVDSPEAPNLKVLPATIDLAGAEIELVSIVARENRLKRALRAYLQDHHADYVFLDCPPSLGLLTLNALVAANEILVPIQCEYYALEGVTQLMRTIDLVKGELNNELRLSIVLLTMFDATHQARRPGRRRGSAALPCGDAPNGHPAFGAHLRGAQLRPDRFDLPAQLGGCHFLP